MRACDRRTVAGRVMRHALQRRSRGLRSESTRSSGVGRLNAPGRISPEPTERRRKMRQVDTWQRRDEEGSKIEQVARTPHRLILSQESGARRILPHACRRRARLAPGLWATALASVATSG